MTKANIPSHMLACPLVFISTAHGERHDIMTATAMFFLVKDPLVVVSAAKNHVTTDLIQQSGAFTVVIAAEEQQELYKKLGNLRGDEVDKFAKLSIAAVPNRSGKAQIPEGTAGWFDCEVAGKHAVDGYIVFVGRVIGHADTEKRPLVWHKDALFTLK